jgi:hypothetical protein
MQKRIQPGPQALSRLQSQRRSAGHAKDYPVKIDYVEIPLCLYNASAASQPTGGFDFSAFYWLQLFFDKEV